MQRHCADNRKSCGPKEIVASACKRPRPRGSCSSGKRTFARPRQTTGIAEPCSNRQRAPTPTLPRRPLPHHDRTWASACSNDGRMLLSTQTAPQTSRRLHPTSRLRITMPLNPRPSGRAEEGRSWESMLLTLP